MSVKISALPVGTAPTGAELIPAVQAAQTVSLTLKQLATLAQQGLTAVDSGAANAYVLTTPQPIPAPFTGQFIAFSPLHPNTGASTASLNGGAATAIVDSQGNALTGGEITGPVIMEWTGSQWELFWQLPLANKRTSAEVANGVVPTNYIWLPGDIQRYGASSAVADNGPAINTALVCNPVVYDGNTSGPIIYTVQTTIRLRAAGQVFRGAGFGDSNTAGGAGAKFAPRTTLKWTGAAGGKVISTSDTVNCYSETVVRDLLIDGNALAQYGIEGFDDALAISGCWRNKYVNVGVMNCTNGNGAAIYTGNGAGTAGKPFANDNFFDNCYLWACARGLFGVMAVPQLHHCTIGNMTVAGVHMKGQGSEIKLYGGVLHSNAWDIIADAGATTGCQNTTAIGTWFENSTSGIYLTNASHSLHVLGCHLHTSSATAMFNMNSQAGSAVIKSWAAAGSVSYAIINTNPAYDYDFVGSGLTMDTGYSQRITQAKGLSRIDNTDFMCAPSADAANATGDGTLYNLNSGAFNFDRNTGNNVSAAGVFTAPADGFYELEVAVMVTGLLATHTAANLYVTLSGGTGTVLLASLNPFAISQAGVVQLFGKVRATMFKNNTAFASVQISGGTKVVTVNSGGGGTNWRTRFTGRLA